MKMMQKISIQEWVSIPYRYALNGYFENAPEEVQEVSIPYRYALNEPTLGNFTTHPLVSIPYRYALNLPMKIKSIDNFLRFQFLIGTL